MTRLFAIAALLSSASAQAAPARVDVSINGVESNRTCQVHRLSDGQQGRAGEALPWSGDQASDLKVVCRRATGELVRRLSNARGRVALKLKMGFTIIWTTRAGQRFDGLLRLAKVGGEERVGVRSGAQVPLLAGSWRVEVVDSQRKGLRTGSLVVVTGNTREMTFDMSDGRVRVMAGAGVSGQFEAIDSNGAKRGFAALGGWLTLPPGRYQLVATRDDDLAHIETAIGQVVIVPAAALERRAKIPLGVLQWRLENPAEELRIETLDGTVLAKQLSGRRWTIAPGTYRVAYRQTEQEILAADLGGRSEQVTVRAGAVSRFGQLPPSGRVVVRLRRGRAPQHGTVEVLNPADGDVVARFGIGQVVRVGVGKWPVRVVASDGVMVPAERLLDVRAGRTATVDLQRHQSRVRVTLMSASERAPGTWKVKRADGPVAYEAVSGEALDLNPGRWIVHGLCAGGRGSAQVALEVLAGQDRVEELACR
jgi:hypothetical protein